LDYSTERPVVPRGCPVTVLTGFRIDNQKPLTTKRQAD
jgi:hypothetical protein